MYILPNDYIQLACIHSYYSEAGPMNCKSSPNTSRKPVPFPILRAIRLINDRSALQISLCRYTPCLYSVMQYQRLKWYKQLRMKKSLCTNWERDCRAYVLLQNSLTSVAFSFFFCWGFPWDGKVQIILSILTADLNGSFCVSVCSETASCENACYPA